MALMLAGCVSMTATPPSISPEFLPLSEQAASPPVIIKSPDSAYAYAQATMDTGQSQLLDLSRKATEVSLNMSQAADAAAQATQDYNQRQKMELDYQATLISMDIAQAAATQDYVKQQTKMARAETSAAQNRAATATHAAYLMNVNKTALARDFFNAQAVQAAQAEAALTAYPKTATPLAKTQAALLMQQYKREQQSFVDQVVVPILPILGLVAIFLFCLVMIVAYRRAIGPRRVSDAVIQTPPNSLILVEGITEQSPGQTTIIPSELRHVSLLSLPDGNTPHVEIVSANEPPVAHWIAELEHQLASKGGVQS